MVKHLTRCGYFAPAAGIPHAETALRFPERHIQGPWRTSAGASDRHLVAKSVGTSDTLAPGVGIRPGQTAISLSPPETSGLKQPRSSEEGVGFV